MASLLNGAGGTTDGIEDPRLQVKLDKPVRNLSSNSVLSLL